MGISNMETTSRRFSGTCVLFLIAWFIFFGNEHNVWSKSYTFVATMLSLPDVYVWTLVCNVVHTHVWHREEVKNIEHRCADETNFDHCVDMNLESLQSGGQKMCTGTMEYSWLQSVAAAACQHDLATAFLVVCVSANISFRICTKDTKKHLHFYREVCRTWLCSFFL